MLKLTKINCRSIVHSYLMLTNEPYCKVLPNNLYIVSIMSRWTLTGLKQRTVGLLEDPYTLKCFKYDPSGFWGKCISSSLNHHCIVLYYILVLKLSI